MKIENSKFELLYARLSLKNLWLLSILGQWKLKTVSVWMLHLLIYALKTSRKKLCHLHWRQLQNKQISFGNRVGLILHNWKNSLHMFRGLFLKKSQTGFRKVLKLLPKNTCTRLSCVKSMGRYIHHFSFYQRFKKFLDKNIAKFSKIRMGSTIFSSLRNRAW